MKARFAPVLAFLFFAAGAVGSRADTVDQVIARARAYLGTESALNAVTSIKFTGTLDGTEKVPSPADKTKLIERPVKIATIIVFQKPYRQLITLNRTDSVDVTALDGYDAWNKSSSTANPAKWRMRLLAPRQIKTLRANTWENLNFYSGLEKKGGTVQMGGESVVDGVPCIKLTFVHDPTITFQRFFDKATGRLIKTITENGTEIREEGEVVVKGVRFPLKIVQKDGTGKITTITFDKVEVNQDMPASEFMVPSLDMTE